MTFPLAARPDTDASKARPLILVVEDDAGIALLETEAIEDLGCDVLRAATGEAALALLAVDKQRPSPTPTLMLLDYSLPDMNAIALLDRIVAQGRKPPPFIVATGAGDEHVAVDLMRRGAHNYLIKDHEFLNILPSALARALADIETARRLAVAEQKLHLAARVLEGTAEAVMVIDADYRIVSVNPAFEYITGRSAQAVLGQSVALLLPGHEKDVEVIAAIRTALQAAGHWQGEVVLRRGSGEIFTAWFNISHLENNPADADQDAAASAASGAQFVSLFSDISSVKVMAEHLDYLAHHDPLTHLPNRLLFNARLRHSIERAARGQHSLGLLFLDLDHFKEVNDRLGHAAGDDLLRLLARRMSDLLREEDTLARLGGDEFVLILEEAENADDLKRVIDQLLSLFPHPVDTPQGMVNVTASIGGALYPQDGSCCDDLLACADKAMYAAKEAGRNTFVLYTSLKTPAATTETAATAASAATAAVAASGAAPDGIERVG